MKYQWQEQQRQTDGVCEFEYGLERLVELVWREPRHVAVVHHTYLVDGLALA